LLAIVRCLGVHPQKTVLVIQVKKEVKKITVTAFSFVSVATSSI
jgi:hypothetical protein